MNQRPIVWLMKKIKKRIPGLLVMTATNVGNALFGVWFALGTRQVINTAVSADKEAFFRACGLQAAIIGGILLTLVLYRYLRTRMAEELDRDWKKELLHTLLRADYSKVSAYHSGELINRLNNDVRAVDEGIITILPGLSSMAAKMIGAAGALLALEPVFSCILLGGGLLLVVFATVARRQLKKLHKQVSQAEGRVSGLLQETLEKLLLVQALDLPEEMERRADRKLNERFDLQSKRRNVSTMANIGVSGMYYLAGFAALIWCAARLLGGTMSFGDLTAVTQLVSQLQTPFVDISGVIPKYMAMIAAAERLMELDVLETEETPMLPVDRYDQVNAICGEDVCFAYDRDEVLSDVSFRLEKGCFAVVTAPSGRGKSTLLKLILGIFRPDSGKLYLDTEHGSIPLERSTRKLFAYVPQGNLLFSGTIRENLLVIKPEATEAELEQALFVSCMDAYLDQLPKGLDTMLGESGAGLSEGQAQRLAIARAILGGAPILLLDEATSALDEETERRVLQRIRSLENRTCIAVTHRPAALEIADTQLALS